MNTKRLDKLESLIKANQIEKGSIVLYNDYGKVVDGVVVKMPTSEAEGIARLADGTEQSIVYENDWNNRVSIFIEKDNGKVIFMDNDPVGNEKDIDLTGKLFMRNSLCEIIKIIPASKAK